MLNIYAPEVNVTITFLKLLKVKVTDITVNETLQEHSDYPSLLSVSDSLFRWNIANGAGKINKEDIGQLPVPFIAPLLSHQTPYVIVSKATDDLITYKSVWGKFGDVTQPKSDFFLKWDGIYLIAETNQDSGQERYLQTRRKEVLSWLLPLVTFLLFMMVVFISVNTAIFSGSMYNGIQTLGVNILVVFFLIGIAITSLLLLYDIDKSNPALQKVCNGIKKTNCSSVLDSKGAKIFNWLNWSELGFIYFFGGVLALLAGTSLNVSSSLTWLSLAVLPYVFFSIYYQWKIVQQWCILCLAVQLLLVLSVLNVLNTQLLSLPVDLTFSGILTMLICYGLAGASWFSIKPVFIKNQKGKNESIQLRKLKYNSKLFEALLSRQKQVAVPTEGLGIVLGNKNAAHTIIKVCNPYCGPCSRAHPEIHKLLESNKNVKAQIIFTATTESNDVSANPVKHLLAIADKGSAELTTQALDDWYLSKNKSYDLFKSKYSLDAELENQENKIDAMSNWCRRMEIRYTPTFFINGYQLPDAYDIEDLKYFLSE